MRTRLAQLALALGAGFVVALAMPPWGFWPLAIVGVALLELSEGPDPSPAGRWWRGFLFGFAWLGMGMGWMSQLTVPGYVVATLIFATLHGLAALVAPTGRWRVLGRPAAHTLVEALRFSWPFGGVPLASMGIGQAGGPLVVVARVGGVILLTWVVFQLGFALGALVERTRRTTIPAFAGLAVGAAVILVALVAPTGRDTGATLDVAAVQGGGRQGTSALDVPSIDVTRAHLAATQTIEPDPELDLVVWPENVVDSDDFAASEEYRAIAAEADRLGVPFAVGVTEDVPGQPGRVTNYQVVITPDGDLYSRYDKVRRVPFGEYVPLRGFLESLGAPVDQVRTNAVAGTEPAVIELPTGEQLATVISWEVFFGGRAREGVKAGGQLLINPTNGASYTGTIVQTQQVASSRLRAVETGRWLVQAAPTGFSEFVSPDGDVIDRTSVSEQAVIRHVIPLRDGRTWYVTIGDGPWIVLLALVLAASIGLTAAERRRSVGAPDPAGEDVSGR